MRRVIAAKKKSDLSNHDYVQYDKYQKITLALNDLKKEQLESKFFQRRQYLLDQVETSPYNGKLTLPVSIDETVSQHIYRKDPKTEKDIIKGQQSNGIGQVIQTGEILNTALKEVFTDVDSTMITCACCSIPSRLLSAEQPSASTIITSKIRCMWKEISATICSLSQPTARTSDSEASSMCLPTAACT